MESELTKKELSNGVSNENKETCDPSKHTCSLDVHGNPQQKVSYTLGVIMTHFIQIKSVLIRPLTSSITTSFRVVKFTNTWQEH